MSHHRTGAGDDNDRTSDRDRTSHGDAARAGDRDTTAARNRADAGHRAESASSEHTAHSDLHPDDDLPTPPRTAHDAFFKKVFSDVENAAAELRAVVPARVAAHIDWASLSLEYASAVGDWLRQRHGDLLYSALTTDNRPIFLWFLFEHQSSVVHLMAWELVQKVTDLMKHWLSNHPDATHLPALLSFVLYNGDARWAAPTSLTDLFDLSDQARRDFGEHLLSYRYVLDDLQATPTDAIDARQLRPHARLSLLAMKHAGTPDMLHQLRLHFADITQLLRTSGGMASLREVVYYLWTLDDELTPDRLIEELEPVVGQEIEHPMRTVAQQLEQRGYDRGFDKGLELGLRRLLVSQLEARFGALPDDLRARIDHADADALERWGTRVLSATTLDDVFNAS
ncbi:Rpn family recombination-promoting nuclease/putative transposase [Haliangium sp.]|uniref:Rpn family recombination-promoting nuclease/putative transposase n=2 Tax=Haliangium sp. TaxID=2663208 RepID=UPI003D0B1120